MITCKFKYELLNRLTGEILESYRRQYSAVYRFIFNRIVDSGNTLSLSELRSFYGTLDGIELIDQCMFHCAISEAKATYESRKALEAPVKKRKESEEDFQKRLDRFEQKRFKPVFGGQKRFMQMNQAKSEGDLDKFNKLKEEFDDKRLMPLKVIGEGNKKGNRKFQVFFEDGQFKVLFKPTRNDHYVFNIKNINKKYPRILSQLILAQEKKEYPLTWAFDSNCLYVSFDEKLLDNFKVQPVKNRVIAVDLNPNYIGYSIVQWRSSGQYEVIDKGLYDLKNLNKLVKLVKTNTKAKREKWRKIQKKRTNLKEYVLHKIAQDLVSKAIHFKCQSFAVEDLKFNPGDKGKGSFFNRLCIQDWNRNILTESIERRCNCFGILFKKVNSSWSSMTGNYLFRHLCLPDPILASIEIGRRAYEFISQYILKDKPLRHNIVWPSTSDFKEVHTKSAEEFGVDCQKSISQAVKEVSKNFGMMIRVSLDQFEDLKFSKWKSQKSLVSFVSNFSINQFN